MLRSRRLCSVSQLTELAVANGNHLVALGERPITLSDRGLGGGDRRCVCRDRRVTLVDQHERPRVCLLLLSELLVFRLELGGAFGELRVTVGDLRATLGDLRVALSELTLEPSVFCVRAVGRNNAPGSGEWVARGGLWWTGSLCIWAFSCRPRWGTTSSVISQD